MPAPVEPKDEILRNLPSLRRAAQRVHENARISDAIQLLTHNPQSRNVYVVDAAGKLLGTISFRSVLRVAKARLGIQSSSVFGVVGLMRDLMRDRARDIMRKPTPVREEDALRAAIWLMEETRENDLPIVDAEGRLVGEVNALAMLDFALGVFQETEANVDRAARDGQG